MLARKVVRSVGTGLKLFTVSATDDRFALRLDQVFNERDTPGGTIIEELGRESTLARVHLSNTNGSRNFDRTSLHLRKRAARPPLPRTNHLSTPVTALLARGLSCLAQAGMKVIQTWAEISVPRVGGVSSNPAPAGLGNRYLLWKNRPGIVREQ